MIYIKELPESLEQGDICQNLPKITPYQINFNELKSQWLLDIKLIETDKIPLELLKYKVEPLRTSGVILSQSCDIRPGFSILFAELKKVPENRLSPNTDKRIDGIKRIIRDETRFHYFPAFEEIILFKEPKLLDFKNLFLIPYEFFIGNIDKFFIARLKPEARAVLCEKISRFFTRLAFEDIMFLSNDELPFYLESLPDEDKKIAEETLENLSEK